METNLIRFKKPETEKLILQSFLSASHTETKRFFREQASLFKEDVNSLYNSASKQLQKIILPINNFLKDIKELDKEIEYESKKQSGLICEGNFVPIDQALLSPMEENY